ncbi:MAG TPA: hypothetical protein G4N93_05385 [Dehalococcoidia bacterium]|nr:hypothetical protein [Dehalococcoidia bacterium]
MNCLECGGIYMEKSGNYELVDPYVGKIIIQGVQYYQCDKCENILYSEAMAQAIESERNKRIREILSQFPISDFISAAETASILGISRQALHKNRRINHGFIYQTKICGLTVYLKQSVQHYKKTGDGRFPLYFHGYSLFTEYLKDTIPVRVSPVYDRYPRTIKSGSPFAKGIHVNPKEYNYAN